MKYILLFLTLFMTNQPKTIYQFKVKTIEGKEISLSEYKDKVVMIVNVASKCGYTPQYKGLQSLYEKYKDKGFVILGFPANNFLWQEPGNDSEIQSFCSLNYNVTFPMFSKVSVKGFGKAPLYKFLTEKSQNGISDEGVKWNFQKFLINRKGNLVQVFSPGTEPLSSEITSAIEKQL